MTPQELERLGKKLGDGWQAKLAIAIPCTVRAVYYWAAGKRAIHPAIALRIKQAVNDALKRE